MCFKPRRSIIWTTIVAKYVVYHEPFYCDYTGKLFNKEIRVTVEDAIEWQKGHAFVVSGGFIYHDDETALFDFVALHWGEILNV